MVTDYLKTALFLFSGLACDLGIVKRQYQQFIIVTTGRSGSTLLAESLAQHPQVVTRDEIFHKDWVFDKWRQKIRQENPTGYVNRFVFHWYPQKIRAVGFVIHYYQPQNQHKDKVWNYLAGSDVKVIHLKRNLFDVFVDSQIARQAGVWNARSDEEAESSRKASIIIDYTQCKNYLEWAEKRREDIDAMFHNHDKLEIWYEDFVSDIMVKIQVVEEWIGVEPLMFQPRTVRQVSRPMSEVVTNFDYLRLQFENTPLRHYFEG